ncbi:MAG TPA: FAD-binding oxidoreductase [Candidatus Acidoferrales bacterium]|nr:FAD-binding oxidoreductase [Candidatus Acidoferrales bacterium]
MPLAKTSDAWGVAPWQIDFTPPSQPLPPSADFAVVGAGFTGLAAAAWVRALAPGKSVVVLEAGRIGHGASGRTGGIVLSETAAGDLPGLGDVLTGFRHILRRLRVDCELDLPGAWEIARGDHTEKSENGRLLRGESPIEWQDSGTLRAISIVPGGSLDPGKQVSGLARAAVRSGAVVLENSEVQRIRWADIPELILTHGRLRASKILFATNALSADLAALSSTIYPKLTLAARTAPLSRKQIESIGLTDRKPFYTVDFPYLWGRLCSDNSIIWGAGLVDPPESGSLERVDVGTGQSARMFDSLEKRIHGLHPALAKATFTHRWGGPIAFRKNFRPIFAHHPKSRNAIVVGVFAGHGVALSVYLGAWAAESLLGRRKLPEWGRIGSERNTSKLW